MLLTAVAGAQSNGTLGSGGGSNFGSPPSANNGDSATISQTVRGRVVDAQTGMPLPRALVNLSGRTMLTDALGRFEFAHYTGTQAGARVTKPGYTQSLDALNQSSQMLTDLTSTITLKLYRDATISGTVVGSDRLPVVRVQVQLFRLLGTDQGNRLLPTGNTSTDSRGQYRFDAPPGRYRVALRYAQRADELGDVMLPVNFPEQTGGETPATFKVDPGQERRVDLQARTGQPYPVTLVTEADRPEGNLRLTAVMGNGASFNLFARPAGTGGSFRVDLPNGSYRLIANQQSRESQLEGESRVTVASKPVEGVVLHLAEIPSIRVEMAVEAVASSSFGSTGSLTSAPPAPPTVQNLNLYLQSLDTADDFGQNQVRMSSLPDQAMAFRANSGIYRLFGNGSGAWYVRSASYGTTDLLTDKLTVAPGTGGEPIRLVVSNDVGQLTGTVTSAGVASRSVVYIMSHGPSLTPVRMVRASSSGVYSSQLPPGSYTVVALDSTFGGDLRSPEMAAKLAGAAQTAEVSSGGKATADLKLMAAELLR